MHFFFLQKIWITFIGNVSNRQFRIETNKLNLGKAILIDVACAKFLFVVPDFASWPRQF
jgi:hypothetical protein